MIYDSDRCLGSLAVSVRPGFDSSLRHRFFFFRLCQLFDPLLHLVANVISKLNMYKDMLSSWRGECDRDQCLAVL